MAHRVKFSATIERKDQKLPHFVVVRNDLIESWRLYMTTIVDLKLNGIAIGRRALKRWDEKCWFIDLTRAQCQLARVAAGDKVEVILQIASQELPKELAELIRQDAAAKSKWDKLTVSQKRMLQEHIREAKLPATRKRRAVCALIGTN